MLFHWGHHLCVCVCSAVFRHPFLKLDLSNYCSNILLTFDLYPPTLHAAPHQESRASSRASEYSSEEGDEDDDYEDDYEEDEGSESEEDED